MIYLPHGARCSELAVTPKNWKSRSASTATPWRIVYRFYPSTGKPVQRVLKGMNRTRDLQERQAITRALIDQELALLRAGMDAVSQTVPAAQDLGEISAYTPLMDALTWAASRMQVVESTRVDIRHYLGRMATAAEVMGLSMRPLGEVRKKDLRAILRSFEKAYQFNKARGYLMSMWEELCQEEAVEANPVRDIKRMKATSRIRETLTREQRQQVDAYLREQHYTFWRFVHIFFHSGGREAEMMQLRREDVDLAGGRYKSMIRKGRQNVERWRPIKDIAAPLWAEVLQEAAPGQYLFSRGLRPGAAPIRVDQLGKRWKRLVKDRLGITADLYSLKHTNLTEVSGILDQEAAARLAGHTSTQMVARVYDVQGADRQMQRIRSISNKFA